MAGLTVTGAVALGALAGCSSDTELGRLGYPAPITETGTLSLSFWQDAWIAAFVVGVITWGLILWAVVVYRRRPGNDGVPVQTRYHAPLEILYTFVPTVMVAVLFAITARDQATLTALTPHPANTVGVIGFKWNWTFNYTDDDAYDTGTPDLPANLWLPVGKTTRFQLTSPDVIHDFWVPAFLFKMDDIPGRQNQFELTPTTIGTFAGRCAELCGQDHSRMLFTVHVVSQADYDAHIALLKAEGQSGQLLTGRVAINAVEGRTR